MSRYSLVEFRLRIAGVAMRCHSGSEVDHHILSIVCSVSIVVEASYQFDVVACAGTSGRQFVSQAFDSHIDRTVRKSCLSDLCTAQPLHMMGQ